jgi:hypothetical protein
MTINDNKKELKQRIIICHKSASGGTIAMICERDEEPYPSATTQ